MHRGAMLNIHKYRLRASSCPDIYRNSMITLVKEDDEVLIVKTVTKLDLNNTLEGRAGDVFQRSDKKSDGFELRGLVWANLEHPCVCENFISPVAYVNCCWIVFEWRSALVGFRVQVKWRNDWSSTTSSNFARNWATACETSTQTCFWFVISRFCTNFAATLRCPLSGIVIRRARITITFTSAMTCSFGHVDSWSERCHFPFMRNRL